ncbi:hypothetical protein ACLPBM_18840 [Escherichia coli]|uniref:hypothetical protein n=1 Tax=Enterobacterales TaxID=91347 RepID=UPI0038919708
MSRYQKAIEDTVLDNRVCSACHGSGTFVGVTIRHEHVMTECEACGGTGTSDATLAASVIRDLGQRNNAQPGYSEPTFIDVPNNPDDYE